MPENRSAATLGAGHVKRIPRTACGMSGPLALQLPRRSGDAAPQAVSARVPSQPPVALQVDATPRRRCRSRRT